MPILNVAVQSETKILLDALSTLMQSPTSRVIDVLASAYLQALPDSEAKAIRRLREAALTRLAADASTSAKGGPLPVATYKFSRLCFKRDVIEALSHNEAFRVETPIGTFQMSHAEFHRAFPNVAQSRSYVENGLYHYRTLPSRAEQFRVV
jgi:hypothetical protein